MTTWCEVAESRLFALHHSAASNSLPKAAHFRRIDSRRQRITVGAAATEARPPGIEFSEHYDRTKGSASADPMNQPA